MGRLRIICSLVFALLSKSFLCGTPLIIEGEDWGDVERNEIHKVLRSTLSLFELSSPTLQKHPIVVSPTADNPMVLYELSDGHAYHIQLTAKNRHWCQYVFQFAHELGHIMCNFRKENHANLWFEESICEVASLYALHRIANKWVEIPNDSNSKAMPRSLTNTESIESKNLHIRKTFSLLSGGIKTGLFYPKIPTSENRTSG